MATTVTTTDITTRTDNQSVVGVYKSIEKAQAAMRALEQAGLKSSNLSLILSSPAEDPPAGRSVQHGDKTEKSVIAGAGIGGLIGLLVGASLLTLPGIVPIMVVGAMAAGLTGAVVGGILGCMAGWGIHEDHIREYEQKVAAGRILIIAHGDPALVADAERVMHDTEVEEVKVHAKTGDDSPEIDDSPAPRVL